MGNLVHAVAEPMTIEPEQALLARCQDYRRIESALTWLAEHFEEQPSLAEAAASVGLSEFHFQRLFSRWVGLSPKRFLQYLSLERAKRSLEESASVLDAAFDAGLSGPGRLHDLFVTYEAVTPGEYKLRGDGLTIRYGFHPSPFGECLLLLTERGITGLSFVGDRDRQAVLEDLLVGWDKAEVIEDNEATAPYMARIFGDGPLDRADPPLRLLLRGTRFQVKVWEALLRIPPGGLASYTDIARRIGQPSAARAVARATAGNLIGYLIPCHRVIRKSGAISDYRWGRGRRLAIIGWEAARLDRVA